MKKSKVAKRQCVVAAYEDGSLDTVYGVCLDKHGNELADSTGNVQFCAAEDGFNLSVKVVPGTKSVCISMTRSFLSALVSGEPMGLRR